MKHIQFPSFECQVHSVLAAEDQLMLDHTPAAIFRTDKKFRYRCMNDAERAIWGVKGDITGAHIGDVMGGFRFDWLKPVLESAFQGEEVEQKFYNSGVDLETLHGEWRATHTPLIGRNGKINSVVSTFIRLRENVICCRCLPNGEHPQLTVDTTSRRWLRKPGMPKQ